jgi:hypothetical protein
MAMTVKEMGPAVATRRAFSLLKGQKQAKKYQNMTISEPHDAQQDSGSPKGRPI